jgi:hypothetical protein
MARTKYKMTDAAAKRIHKRLLEIWQKGHHINISDVEMVLKEEDFWGSYKANYVSDLVQFLLDNSDGPANATFVDVIAQAYIRSHYILREGIDDIHGGLQTVGILPYPEDDS